MSNTRKTDKFSKALAEAEKNVIEKVEETREALQAERARTEALEAAVDAFEEAVEDVEARAKAGDPEVTGKALVEARGDMEVATMAQAGNQSRIKRLSDWLGKIHARKDVAEIVREALVAHMVPGAASYATFVKMNAKPDSLPALTVQQLDGGMGNDGVGAGKVKITWHRSDLHAPLDSDRLRAALEAAEFVVNETYGFNNGVNVVVGKDSDEAVVELRGVADQMPVSRTPLENVEGWDESLALQVNRSQDVDAQGVGARIVSTDEDDNGIRTTVVRLSLGVKQTNYGDTVNLSGIVKAYTNREVGSVRPKAGRCTNSKVNLVHHIEDESAKGGIRRALASGQFVYAVEYTYVAKSA